MELARELSEAVRVGDEAVVRRLLASGAQPDQADQYGVLPIHLAAHCGHEGLVKLLLDADPATALAVNSMGSTPLHWAAAAGNFEIMKLLLEAAPAAATMLNRMKWAPIHHAAYWGHAAIMHVLMETALMVAYAPDANGETPLQIVLSNESQRPADQVEATARCLVRVAPAVQPTLGNLVQYSQRSATLFADLVARLPLSQEQWQSIPAPCPDLARVLPVVLERSVAEAGWLVGRLAGGQRAWLQMTVLCMAPGAA